jgi:DNA-binding transcriptional regulator YbjK
MTARHPAENFRSTLGSLCCVIGRLERLYVASVTLVLARSIDDYHRLKMEIRMPGTRQNQDGETEKSPQKLVSAAILAWETDGATGISARTLAASAGLPVSSIYYHFGDLERLLETAQDHARAAATRWCDAQLDAIRGQTESAALGPLLATVIDDWCEQQRPLAFAARECRLMALRDPRHAATSARWDILWQSFWQAVCDRLGIADMATSTTWVFEGTSGMHLLRWRRPVDRGALSELCNGWARWMEGRLAEPSAWFDLARRDAAALIAPAAPDDPVAAAIATAAATTVAQRGVAALTHRAVAAEAGVTLGVVSYKYRTSAELLHAAFEAIYRRMSPQSADELAAVPDLGRDTGLARVDGGIPTRADLLASDELLVASARNPTFQTFAAQLRYLRGRSSGHYLQALVGRERPIAPVDAAIFSAFMSGRIRSYLSGGRTHVPGVPTGDLSALLARLDPR